jgi:hypothetical protein
MFIRVCVCVCEILSSMGCDSLGYMILQFCNYIPNSLWKLTPDIVGKGRITKFPLNPIEITHARKGFECGIIISVA